MTDEKWTHGLRCPCCGEYTRCTAKQQRFVVHKGQGETYTITHCENDQCVMYQRTHEESYFLVLARKAGERQRRHGK